MKKIVQCFDRWIAPRSTETEAESQKGRAYMEKPRKVLATVFRRAEPWLIVLACIPALTLISTIIRIFSSRLAFPMDLEWIEGGQLLHAHRVMNGQELFTEPKWGFMPFSYPPGHAYLLAFLGKIFGLDFWLGRLVSLGSFCGLAFILAREVYREFQSNRQRLVWPILAVGMMVAAFPLTAGWFDLIRNDELLLLLVATAAVWGLDPGPMSRTRFFGMVLLMNCAAFTKQTAVFYLTWIILFQLFRNWRRGLALALVLGLAGLLTTVALEVGTDRRFLFYNLSVLKDQVVHKHMYEDALNKWRVFAPYLIGFPILVVVSAWFRLLSARTVLWLGMLVAAVPASMLPYAKQGGYLNNLLPVAVFAGPVLLCWCGALIRSLALSGRGQTAAHFGLAFSVAAYLQNLQFEAKPFEITEDHRARAGRLYERLASLGDSVWMPHHPFVAIKAGSKVEQIHEMSWVDWWLAGVKGLKLEPFLDKIQPQYIVLTGMEAPLMREAVQRDYGFYSHLDEGELVRPLTGYPSFPRYILERLPEQPDKCLFDFERGWPPGGTQTGTAFRRGPQRAGAGPRSIVIGQQGQRMASSLAGREGEAATGTYTSGAFELTGTSISLLVGGGDNAQLRVELLVDGRTVHGASGTGLDILRQVQWDVSEHQGRQAQLRIVDEDRSSHVLVDQVCLSSR